MTVPRTEQELARAIFYGIEQAREQLGPVDLDDDKWGAHAILANIPILKLIAILEGKNFRDLFLEEQYMTKFSDTHLDWWPEYPDWVFDDSTST